MVENGLVDIQKGDKLVVTSYIYLILLTSITCRFTLMEAKKEEMDAMKLAVWVQLYLSVLGINGLWANNYKELYSRKDVEIPYPEDNTFNRARFELGHKLFFDPRLSGSNFISCATCHNPAFAWEDGLPRALGHGMKELGRHSPTILNLAWAPILFWDGRAETLEEQALGPIQDPHEMNLPLDEMERKLKSIKGYAPLFEAAYPKEGISRNTVAKAIATFERGIVSATAPFDRWIEGDESAINDAAKRGFKVYNEKGLCAKCHSGWRFTDDSFHDIGVNSQDVGRGKFLAEVAVLQHAFKTPTLRNIAQRAPYMHNGSEKTLDDVIEYYNQGGRVRRPSIAFDVRPLRLSRREKSDLKEFLLTLTSQDRKIMVPVLPH
jgi:cytochrome c peroxidase